MLGTVTRGNSGSRDAELGPTCFDFVNGGARFAKFIFVFGIISAETGYQRKDTKT